MESMHSYSDFPSDVIKSFDSIINQFNFKAVKESMTCVLLSNETTQISLSMDRFDLMCLIIEKNARPRKKFGIVETIKFLNPKFDISDDLKSFTHHSYGERANETLDWYAKMINKYLNSVLKGNFSWSEELFRIVYAHRIKNIDFIYKHFPKDHEIIKLYEAENGNWEPKLYTYLSENNIKI